VTAAEVTTTPSDLDGIVSGVRRALEAREATRPRPIFLPADVVLVVTLDAADVARRVEVAAMAEVDLGERVHRNRRLRELIPRHARWSPPSLLAPASRTLVSSDLDARPP
jgi:hypothetical protein